MLANRFIMLPRMPLRTAHSVQGMQTKGHRGYDVHFQLGTVLGVSLYMCHPAHPKANGFRFNICAKLYSLEYDRFTDDRALMCGQWTSPTNFNNVAC